MKKLITILFAVALGLNLSAQDECSNPQDANQDGVIGVDDLMDLLSHWGDTDFDFDGVYDSVDLCTDEGACNYLSNPTESCLYLDAIGACGGDWSQLGGDIDGEAADDLSGYSVSLSSDGTVVAIGVHANDGNGNSSGHTRIYAWDGSSWSQLGEDIDGEAANDWSGYSVSLSSDGTVVAIGAFANDGNGSGSGHTRIYAWDGSSWSQLGGDIDGEAANDYSGYSVSLSSDGTVVAIGALFNDGNGSDSAGHTRIYAWNGSSWSQLGEDIDGEAAYDRGYSVSLSSDGTVVAIGAHRNDGNGSDSGHTRIYSIN